ncbi:MAG: hypothetical protein E7461_02575 [Ruminococcaceae bacterium]|nr:hypothetical protein [Oscillospiraceae bacterium]
MFQGFTVFMVWHGRSVIAPTDDKENGQWTIDNGQWTMDNGQWTMDSCGACKVINPSPGGKVAERK